jgi:hypothetical protein
MKVESVLHERKHMGMMKQFPSLDYFVESEIFEREIVNYEIVIEVGDGILRLWQVQTCSELKD